MGEQGRPLSENVFGGGKWDGQLDLAQGKGVAWMLHFCPVLVHRRLWNSLSTGIEGPGAWLVWPPGLGSCVPRAEVWGWRWHCPHLSQG